MSNLNTLIIFDWDDTLFPTSWVARNNIKLGNLFNIGKHIMSLYAIDDAVSNLLSIALTMSHVVIITNSTLGWFNLSKKLLPISAKIIDDKIKVISARDNYEKKCDITMWKRNAFNFDILEYSMRAKQIISIGDANYEYDALISLHRNMYVNKYYKNIKLIDKPSIEYLIDQQQLLTNLIKQICSIRGHLDLNFKDKQLIDCNY